MPFCHEKSIAITIAASSATTALPMIRLLIGICTIVTNRERRALSKLDFAFGAAAQKPARARFSDLARAVDESLGREAARLAMGS